jgi:hypothetical protein
MAITQERVMALINAGNDYRQAFQTLVSMIVRGAQEVSLDQSRLPFVSSDIFNTAADAVSLLRQPVTSEKTLDIEARHFERSRISNIKNKQRMAAKRYAPKREDHLTPKGPMFFNLNVTPDTIVQMREDARKAMENYIEPTDEEVCTTCSSPLKYPFCTAPNTICPLGKPKDPMIRE